VKNEYYDLLTGLAGVQNDSKNQGKSIFLQNNSAFCLQFDNNCVPLQPI
jgi:hypothetical protein